MVRAIYTGQVVNGKQYVEYAGLSTDVKPLGNILTGSKFHEVDTGYIFAYNESGGGEWVKNVELMG